MLLLLITISTLALADIPGADSPSSSIACNSITNAHELMREQICVGQSCRPYRNGERIPKSARRGSIPTCEFRLPECSVESIGSRLYERGSNQSFRFVPITISETKYYFPYYCTFEAVSAGYTVTSQWIESCQPIGINSLRTGKEITYGLTREHLLQLQGHNGVKAAAIFSAGITAAAGAAVLKPAVAGALAGSGRAAEQAALTAAARAASSSGATASAYGASTTAQASLAAEAWEAAVVAATRPVATTASRGWSTIAERILHTVSSAPLRVRDLVMAIIGGTTLVVFEKAPDTIDGFLHPDLGKCFPHTFFRRNNNGDFASQSVTYINRLVNPFCNLGLAQFFGTGKDGEANNINGNLAAAFQLLRDLENGSGPTLAADQVNNFWRRTSRTRERNQAPTQIEVEIVPAMLFSLALENSVLPQQIALDFITSVKLTPILTPTNSLHDYMAPALRRRRAAIKTIPACIQKTPFRFNSSTVDNADYEAPYGGMPMGGGA